MNNLTGPSPKLSLIDAVAIIVGLVIGAGIFRTPSLVAGNTEGDGMFLLAWVIGGLISFIGALCYAELCTAFPDAGGDYHFITRAFGHKLAFLFAWSRMSIIQTGSIALLAYISGDYFTQMFSLGEYSAVIYAAIVVIVLTGINLAGLHLGTRTQRFLTSVEVAGVLLIIGSGLFFTPAFSEVNVANPVADSAEGNFPGLAMVFVLLTFGGWNEAAYISSELKTGEKRMTRSLVFSLIIITLTYLLINIAYLRTLGHAGLAQSEAAGADLMKIAWGDAGVWLISILVAISALTSANATIFTGARSNYALGKDFRVFSILGKWDDKKSGPFNAFLIQGIISLALISLGLITRSGFQTMIEYTAPVFWFFFLLVGISLFVLRWKEPDARRPFKVPFYPLTPIIFCLSSLYLLYSSLVYTGMGALAGIGVLVMGGMLLLIFPVTKKTV